MNFKIGVLSFLMVCTPVYAVVEFGFNATITEFEHNRTHNVHAVVNMKINGEGDPYTELYKKDGLCVEAYLTEQTKGFAIASLRVSQENLTTKEYRVVYQPEIKVPYNPNRTTMPKCPNVGYSDMVDGLKLYATAYIRCLEGRE